jgi:ketosteroid isomerase-like protein/fermentation-respiration switch protein FrsA (DUF1100 family)
MTRHHDGERVTFESEGETIVGLVFPAAFGAGPGPAVAILGPMTFQKEQSPVEYARRLARLGYTALAFDTRCRGESGGEPRGYEDPVAKGRDLSAALRYLAGRPDVDGDRLAVLGICMGAGHVLPVAADDPLVRAVATVAGHYRDHASDVTWLGSETAVADRLARGREVVAKHEATGEVVEVPAVDFSRSDVGMPGELVWSWYQLWDDRGLWDNRYPVMSDAALFSFDSITAAARLTRPFLMIHSDQCAVPDAARRHFAVVPTADKRLLWQDRTRHLQFYDDPAVIDETVWEIVDWFSRHLGPGGRLGLVRRFFDLMHAKDIDAWGDLWAEAGRIVVPYPPEGFPTSIDGRDTIVANFRTLFAGFDTFDYELTGVHPAADSDAVTVEYDVHAVLRDGTEYRNHNIAIFRFDGGRISAYHDYFDPRLFQTVVDALS